ncbi:MAG: hypothetical protein JXA11_01020 [Phycisphaerae bacterium]|nr:hypothetical protein [Phycisphaerae bacterium]
MQQILSWEAIIPLSWTVGLLLAVAVLLANNPHKTLPQLPFPNLYRLIALPILSAALLGVVGGILGWLGYLSNLSDDLQLLTLNDVWRPSRFCCAWGVHLGGYIGGPIGAAWSVILIRRKRKHLAKN